MSAAALDKAAAFIAPFEGFRSRPYRDAVGVWTIGYGETKGIGPNSPAVTEPQARAQMRRRLAADYAPAIDRMGLALNVNQEAALLSVIYNLGPGVLDHGRSLGDALRAHAWHAAADAILLYDKAGGKTLAGLTRRRQAERALFLSAPAGVDPRLKKWRRQLGIIRAAAKVVGWLPGLKRAADKRKRLIKENS